MSKSLKRGWYVVYLPTLISLPLFLLVAFINEVNIKENAQVKVLEELYYKTDYVGKSLHYLIEQQAINASDYNFDEFVDSLASNSQTHVSIFSLKGKLLGDNFSSGYSLMASPIELQQPEIAQAARGKKGSIIRYNPQISRTMRYISKNEGDFIVRVGLSTTFEQQFIIQRRYDYVPTFLILFFITSIGGYFFIHWINDRLKQRYQRLKQRVHSQTAELLLLQEFGTLLTLSKSLNDIEQVLTKFAQMLLYHDAGVVTVIRSSRNLAEIKIKWGEENWFETNHYTLDACWSLRKGYAHPQGPYDRLIRCSHDTERQSNVICIPLVAQGETLGVMHFKRNNCEDEYDENDRKVATSIAEQVALSIANLQLRDNLRNQAIRDSLTGLFNRRYFVETAEKELSRAIKQKSMMSVIMIDLDNFKKLNDSFGHDTGDKVLMEFGALLNKLTHNEHVACRMGGEEFVVLLTDTSIDLTQTFAQTLLDQLRELKIINNGINIGSVTASIGISTYPDGANDISSIVKLADQALYLAKEQGRDRIMFSTSPKRNDEKTNTSSNKDNSAVLD